ncbi:MAG: gluconolaconase [Gammaproteobacteria bacterium]
MIVLQTSIELSVRYLKTLGTVGVVALITMAGEILAQQQPQPRDYYVGNAGVGLPVAPATTPEAFAPASKNVHMYGALYSVESCTYDPGRGVIVAPSRGVGQAVRANDAWLALINHDGSVHTPRWVGVQNAGAERDSMTPPLVLNEPAGSFLGQGMLYFADRDGGTPDATKPGQATASVAVLRTFDLATGRPLKSIPFPGSTGLNDIAVAADGTVYGTNTGAADQPGTWVVWKLAPDGRVSEFVKGAPLNMPNGIEVDGDGNIVVVNIGSADVISFAPDGRVVRTEQAAQSGNDGLVIMPDGVKFVSSVRLGGISMIAPGARARLIAENIPSAASMCYDSGANQLVIPMNANNGLAFVSLKGIWSPKRSARSTQ